MSVTINKKEYYVADVPHDFTFRFEFFNQFKHLAIFQPIVIGGSYALWHWLNFNTISQERWIPNDIDIFTTLKFPSKLSFEKFRENEIQEFEKVCLSTCKFVSFTPNYYYDWKKYSVDHCDLPTDYKNNNDNQEGQIVSELEDFDKSIVGVANFSCKNFDSTRTVLLSSSSSSSPSSLNEGDHSKPLTKLQIVWVDPRVKQEEIVTKTTTTSETNTNNDNTRSLLNVLDKICDIRAFITFNFDYGAQKDLVTPNSNIYTKNGCSLYRWIVDSRWSFDLFYSRTLPHMCIARVLKYRDRGFNAFHGPVKDRDSNNDNNNNNKQ